MSTVQYTIWGGRGQGKKRGAAGWAAPLGGGGLPEGPVQKAGHFGPGDGGEGGHIPGVGEGGEVAVGGEEAETVVLF